ncbi:hypothetical protein MPSEU_000928700 [Mayamaea pseudoterrestris]|nr:hypothetical protein MPSEU_000928700 [Mayamaea pseudoterrestris]
MLKLLTDAKPLPFKVDERRRNAKCETNLLAASYLHPVRSIFKNLDPFSLWRLNSAAFRHNLLSTWICNSRSRQHFNAIVAWKLNSLLFNLFYWITRRELCFRVLSDGL